jgi:hypothetical protein
MCSSCRTTQKIIRFSQTLYSTECGSFFSIHQVGTEVNHEQFLEMLLKDNLRDNFTFT